MARSPSFCGVILAAGESSRMGRDKALLPWHGGTFLSGAIDALKPHVDLVLVVVGKNKDALTYTVDAAGAFLIENVHPERGQFSSLQTGLQEVLNRGRDAAIIALVDRPPARVETVELLKEQFLSLAEDQNKWAVVPEQKGVHGHPIVVGREMINAFLKAPASSNARDVEHSVAARIAYVPVADPYVAANVDTPEDYDHVQHG
jgi:molybdenum cofactor cytidylyltransferase